MLKQPFFLFIFDIKQTVCTKTLFIVSKYMPKKKLNHDCYYIYVLLAIN